MYKRDWTMMSNRVAFTATQLQLLMLLLAGSMTVSFACHLHQTTGSSPSILTAEETSVAAGSTVGMQGHDHHNHDRDDEYNIDSSLNHREEEPSSLSSSSSTMWSMLSHGSRVARQAVDSDATTTTTTVTPVSAAATSTTTTVTTTLADDPTMPPKIAETNINGLLQVPGFDTAITPPSSTSPQQTQLLNAMLAQICYNMTNNGSSGQPYAQQQQQQQQQPGTCTNAAASDGNVTKDGYVLAVQIEASMPNITYVGTTVAAYNQFPFYATVFATNNRQTGTLCGGAFIDTKTVVTAASCFYDAKGEKYSQVRVTDSSSAELIVPRYASWLMVSRSVITHRQYSSQLEDAVRYNIAVINLVVEATNVGTLPLASRPKANDLLYGNCNRDNGADENALTVLGFGRIGTGMPQMYLRYQRVQAYSNEVCSMVYGPNVCDATVFTGRNLDTGNSALCNTESGAPLIRKINAQGDLRLYGIGSFIPKRGCKNGALDGYVSVGYFRNWIIANTRYEPSVSEVITRPQPVETFTYTPWGMSF